LIGLDSKQGEQALASESNDPSEEGLDPRRSLTGDLWRQVSGDNRQCSTTSPKFALKEVPDLSNVGACEICSDDTICVRYLKAPP
jgi:hypothetical protein